MIPYSSAHGALPPQPSAPRRRASPSAPRPAPRRPEAPELASGDDPTRPPPGFAQKIKFHRAGWPPAHDRFVGFVGDSRASPCGAPRGGETKPNRPRNATSQTGKVGPWGGNLSRQEPAFPAE